MKILKHLLKVASAKSKTFFCKHEENVDSSCPYTGLTYTYCKNCMKKTNTRKTND